jgi:DNA-directed RNA polymerase subunit RPC12/RpoP
MPIVRSYMCEECAHQMTVTLSSDQWDAPAPDCPHCTARDMRQEFKPVAITGSVSSKANAVTEQILAEDYGVADMQRDRREGSTPKHRYKDQGTPAQAGAWGATGDMLSQAVAIGRQTRMASGGLNGVDILQKAIKSGAQPDLIENSKRQSLKVW